MAWQTTAPDGTKSVKANNSILQDNTNYIKTTMNVDHFWDDDTAGNDGHHRFVQMLKSDSGGTPTDPSLAADMDGLIYAKELTSTESVNNQDVQPFYINETAGSGVNPQVMQLLGIRAMCVFTIGAGPGFTITELYKHNCTVTRASAGFFTATFGLELPSADYIAIGGCTYPTALGQWYVAPSLNPGYKSSTQLIFATATNAVTTISDPEQVWFVVFGG